VPKKVENLRKLIGPRDDVFIYEGNCNQILLEKVFPRVRYEEYRRGYASSPLTDFISIGV
jgi:hypothetical protein